MQLVGRFSLFVDDNLKAFENYPKAVPWGHNITHLFGCVLWDRVLHEHDYPLILEPMLMGEYLSM